MKDKNSSKICKKFSASVLTAALLCVPGLPAGAQGEIVGEAVNTDIAAYINGLPIPSYNINGYTGIVAEDLAAYGFEVYWDGTERTLSVAYSPEFVPVTADYVPQANTQPIGSHAADIYATDIKTFVWGDEVPSWNIGGQTVILMDSLQSYGNVVWYPQEREIRFVYQEPWSIVFEPDYSADTSAPVSRFSGTFTRNDAGGFDVTGENLAYLSNIQLRDYRGQLQFGFSVNAQNYSAAAAITDLCWQMSTIRYDGERLLDSAELANRHVTISVNGQPLNITEVSQSKGNNHEDFYFWLDAEYAREDIQSVSIVLE